MIHFSCSCGMKFKVKDDFAGRATKCPTCKQTLTVPLPDRTVAHVPEGQIDGTASSLVQAGIDGGVTVGQEALKAGQKSVSEILARQPKKGQRYIVEKEIARGGMGAVLRAVDCDIRREVAVKYLLQQADARSKARFVEEAQITGQLEHPNIPPVHELGVDKDKRLFFAMKMVKGRSLAEVLDELRKDPKNSEYSLGRLLNVLVNVCNGLAYAHSRGVIHRDLKPANVMVGDFGEVYVMDWGLAKVLKGEGQAAVPIAAAVSGLAPSAMTAASTKVATSREPDADLTQEGAVVGTPVYMPPEQALGKLDAIDQRSDVYSLGAILYEMLTLQPPVDKDGGYLAILMRVTEGEIVAPQKRNPRRAIPRELSAIAMKALANDPKDRYQTVEALRKDVERFQEGRSVSAKEDSFRETLWKLVKRNKGFSAGMAATLLVLVLSLGFIGNAYLALGKASAAYVRESEDKQRRTKEAVPAFVDAARMWSENRKLDDALVQVNLALDYDRDYPPARLLKSQILIARKDFAAAHGELERYLALRPDDGDAGELRRLCDQVKPDDGERFLAISDVLLRQRAPGLSDYLIQETTKLIQSNEKRLPLLRRRLEASWPGLGKKLGVAKDGTLSLDLGSCGAQVRDLAPLRDMPLASLSLGYCSQVRDLEPLKGMKLRWLDLGRCAQVRDLAPLQGMKLTYLNLLMCHGVPDLTPLQGMPLTYLNLQQCAEVRDLTPLKGMPLTYLNLDCCGGVRDLTPLQGMKLTFLAIPNLISADGNELKVLQGMPLTTLYGSWVYNLRDLTPLQGLPLRSLALKACGAVHDLTPLKQLPLRSLDLIQCDKVKDLSPLAGMQLEEICFTPKYVTAGMDALRQMKSLKTVILDWNGVERLPVAEFWKKYDAGEFR